MNFNKLNEKLTTILKEDEEDKLFEEDVFVTMISNDGSDKEYTSHYTINGNTLTNEMIGDTETFDEPIDDDTLIEYILNNEYYPVISITRNDEEIFLDDEYMNAKEKEYEED